MGKILHIYLPEWFSIAGHFGAVRDARSRSEQRIHQPHKKADDHRMGRALPRPRVGSFVPGWQPPRRNVYGAKKKDTFPCPFPGLSPGRGSKTIKLPTCSIPRQTTWPSGRRQTPIRAGRCREAGGCWAQGWLRLRRSHPNAQSGHHWFEQP